MYNRIIYYGSNMITPSDIDQFWIMFKIQICTTSVYPCSTNAIVRRNFYNAKEMFNMIQIQELDIDCGWGIPKLVVDNRIINLQNINLLKIDGAIKLSYNLTKLKNLRQVHIHMSNGYAWDDPIETISKKTRFTNFVVENS